MACYSYGTAIGAKPCPLKPSNFQIFTPKDCLSLPIIPTTKKIILRINRPFPVFRCSSSNFSSATFSQSETEEEEDCGEEEDEKGNGSTSFLAATTVVLPPVRRQRRRYRKQYPGEKKGITEEMRFIAMKLRNSGRPPKSKRKAESDKELEDGGDGGGVEEAEVGDGDGDVSVSVDEDNGGGNGESWQPTTEGFLKYLVDSELVFSTIERIVDESSDVSYAYFRKTGLERADCISRDLEWFRQQGNVIPEPNNPGVDYSKYLEELAETNPPLFLCHFYNIYFSHIAGGQVIAKKVSEKLLEGRVLEFYTWEGDVEKLLQGVRENLNMLSEVIYVHLGTPISK